MPLFGTGIGAGIFPGGTFPTGLGATIDAGAVGVGVGVSTIIEADLQTLLSTLQEICQLVTTTIGH